MGSPSENIRAARIRAGLQPEDVARAVGLSKPSYYDIEGRDDEVTGNISVATLMAIARTLGTTAAELLDGAGTVAGAPKRSSSEIVDLTRARIAAEHVTVEAYGDRIGWDMAPVLKNPEHVWRYPFVMLQALCGDLGVDWKEFVDGTDRVSK
jgi:transcriptional regulator with XRE-family HTH domain